MIRTFLHICEDQGITSNVQCGIFLAYVNAMNVAGESDSNNNVSINLFTARPCTSHIKI